MRVCHDLRGVMPPTALEEHSNVHVTLWELHTWLTGTDDTRPSLTMSVRDELDTNQIPTCLPGHKECLRSPTSSAIFLGPSPGLRSVNVGAMPLPPGPRSVPCDPPYPHSLTTVPNMKGSMGQSYLVKETWILQLTVGREPPKKATCPHQTHLNNK